MIVIILSTALFLTFTILGGFHFYWLFVGTWGLKKVIPTKSRDTTTLIIPKFATLLVGLVLISFGVIYLTISNFILISIPQEVIKYGKQIIPFVFILRAIGEFNYVGVFKKIKDTEFAKADSKLFSPLCLIIGVIGVLILLMT